MATHHTAPLPYHTTPHIITTLQTPSNVVFLDEVSVDNRASIRKRGYGKKGRPLIVRGEYGRMPRVSMLSFATVSGVNETFMVEGTFNRTEFFKCCRAFALSGLLLPLLYCCFCFPNLKLASLYLGNVRQYPGPGSIWILDGARIHCDPSIIHYLRGLGIVPIFLPAYCPFFNPIEHLFGHFKRMLKKIRRTNRLTTRTLPLHVATIMKKFSHFDLRNIYRHCGFGVAGAFNPTRAYKPAPSV
jgi:hypothetical protein